jgi:alpha-aminoadipic semialdehyde synthase
MHMPIAHACLAHGKPLVTASYKGDMGSVEAEAKRRGVPIMVEMGLDPGMDHMSAQAVIDDVHALGGTVESFSSVCGGLPAPEAADNPLAYKFSWSPIGVLMAASNPAKYLKNGQLVVVPGEELLPSAEPVSDWLRSLNLEVLPNRDSLPYGDVYGLSGEASSLFRGTLRYGGWSSVMFGFRLLGLLDTATEGPFRSARNWTELMTALCPGGEAQVLARAGAPQAAARVLETLKWLGIYGPNPPPVANSAPSLRHAFCALLESRLTFQSHERDMVLMRHVFGIRKADGNKQVRESSFIGFGSGAAGPTMMARTVGLTCAIGAQLILSGVVKTPGVLLPTTKEIYRPALLRLQQEGLDFVETVRDL